MNKQAQKESAEKKPGGIEQLQNELTDTISSIQKTEKELDSVEEVLEKLHFQDL